MDFLTRIDPTRPLNRLLKGAGRNAAEGMREELVKAADYVFDQKVAPLTYIINCMITDRISQAQNVAKRCSGHLDRIRLFCFIRTDNRPNPDRGTSMYAYILEHRE